MTLLFALIMLSPRFRDAWGAHSGVGAGGGAVAFVELLSGSSILPEGAPLSSCRYGNEVESVEVYGGPRGASRGSGEGRR